MAKITLVIEDLPEGDADILEMKVETDDEIDKDRLTPAQEIAAVIMGVIEMAKENTKNDSMSKVQEKD